MATDPGGKQGQSQITRRKFAAGLLTAGVVGAAGGRLSSRYSDPLQAGDASSASRERKLTILSGLDVSQGGQRNQLLEQWNLANPDSQAQIVPLSPVADFQRSEILSRAQAGDPVDIYNLDVTWVAEFARAGHIIELPESQLDVDGFLKEPLATCRWEGRLWALPFNTDVGLLYYRSDLVSEVPFNWADLVDEAQKVLADEQNSALEAGYAGQLASYEGLTVNALEAVWEAGGRVVNEHGRPVVGSEDAQEGLNNLWKGLHGERLQIVLPASLAFQEKQSLQAFIDGKTVFLRHWPYAFREIKSAWGSGESSGDDSVRLGVAQLPGSGALGGQNLAVSAYSPRPQAAQALVEFLTSARSQQILFERGGFAATREIVYADTKVQEQYGGGYVGTLLDALREAKSRPRTPYYPEFSYTFATEVHGRLEGSNRVTQNWADELEVMLGPTLDGH